MKVKKPKPQLVYDCYEVYDYLQKKHGFTNESIQEFKDWIKWNYESLIYPCECILTLNLEGDIDDPIIEKILNCLIEDFSSDGFEVLIKYWW